MRNLTIHDLYVKDCIRTNSGQYVNFRNPNPDTVMIKDIAHSLSKEQRFANALNVEYSVLSHSLLVAFHPAIPKELRLTALLHDGPEAYLHDVPTPLKCLLPDYQKIEDKFSIMLAEKFGTVFPLPQVVKDVDRELLELEFRVLYMHQNKEKAYKELAIQIKAMMKYSISIGDLIKCLDTEAYVIFMREFNKITEA